MELNKSLASGLLERIGESKGRLINEHAGEGGADSALVREGPVADHEKGMAWIVELLTDPKAGAIRDASQIDAVGHRVVHGGESFQKPTLIDGPVIAAIRKNIPLAPLHNPANLVGIEVARAFFPDAPHVAVFDTAFHQDLPPRAFHYGLPHEFYQKYSIRRYGFHGTSHQYVAKQAASVLGKPLPDLNLITIHLGGGSSITAIKKGKSVDTSMGMTPLEGLVMGTRSGDLDPSIPFHLAEVSGMSFPEIIDVFNHRSGLKGLCGTNDMREVLKKREAGDPRAGLAIDVYTYRLKKYIGAYFAALGDVDALVFTAGVGENSSEIRAEACNGLENFGIELDLEKNMKNDSGPFEIHSEKSRVKVLVVPTDEELEIANQTMEVIKEVEGK